MSSQPPDTHRPATGHRPVPDGTRPAGSPDTTSPDTLATTTGTGSAWSRR